LLHGDPFGSPVRYASPCRSRWLIDRAVSLASRPRLRVSRSLRIDRRGSTGVTLAASARLAGGRGDAVASPALPLRIAPCRSHPLIGHAVSLASRPRLRMSRSLRIDRRVSPGMSLAASARLAGGRGDAVASPALPLRIAPCRCHRAGADRHGSLASRRSLRIAGSLRIAVAIALAYRPRPSRSHRGHASACRARYASTGAVRPKPGSLAVPQCLRIASTSYASLGHPVLRTDPVAG
jgi:hypothetical protein